MALLQRRLCYVTRIPISGSEQQQCRQSARCGDARERSVWLASAAVVPAASSTPASAADRPASRQWNYAGTGKCVDITDRRRPSCAHLFYWSSIANRCPSFHAASDASATTRLISKPRDADHDDDVTHIADVGHDRYVTKATRCTSGMHQKALHRP